jgi:hypothetical protein
MTRFALSVLLLASLLVPFQPAQAADSLDELLNAVPNDANVVMVVRVQDVLKSPKAIKEEWARKQGEAWQAGAEAIPPFLSDLVRAAHLHLEDSSLGWSLGVARTIPAASLNKLAEHHNGLVERIGKNQVVKTQKNSYFTLLGPKLVGVLTPAYRQDAARWLRFASTNKTPQISPYLSEAVKNTSPIVIAIDAQDMLDPDALKGWLSGTRALEGKPGKVTSVASIYNQLQGITLAVNITDQTTFTLTLNFAVPVGIEGPEIKKTLIEYLDDSGAGFSELDQAEVVAKGQAVTLSAPLTDVGLRRIFSLLVTANPGGGQGETAAAPPVPQAEVDAKNAKTASQRYFAALEQVVNDLSARNAKATDYQRTAVWHDQSAKQIENLTIKDVDPALTEYGRTLTQRLRALAASLRGVALRLSNAQGQLVVDYQVNPGQFGGWGGGWWLGGAMYSPPTWRATSNLDQVRQKQATAIEQGSDEREQIWQAIEADRQTIRQKMLMTFGEDFAQPSRK